MRLSRTALRLAAALAILLLAPAGLVPPPGGQPWVAAAHAQTPARLLAIDAGLLFAQALRVKDVRARADLLEQAQGLIDRIQAEHPESEEAGKLRADEKVVGLSPSILAAAREAVRRELEAGGMISSGDRSRCLGRPTMSCLFDLAAVTARQVESKGRRIALLAEVAEARARGGELEKALILAKPLAYGTPDGPGARALTEIAALKAQSGLLEPALEIAADLPGRAATDRARARIVTVLAAAGALEPAASLAEKIETEGPLIEARAAIALADGGAGGAEVLDGGIEAAHRLSDPRESDSTLEALVVALAVAGDFPRAAKAARQIIDLPGLRRGMTEVARRWAAAGGVAEALKLARELGPRNGGARLVVRIAEARLALADYRSVAAILDGPAGPEAAVQILNRVAAAGLTGPDAQAWAGALAGMQRAGARGRGLAIAARALAAAGEAAPARVRLDEALAAAAGLDEWERAPLMLEAAAVELFLGAPTAARDRLAQVPAGTFWADEVIGLAQALAGLAEPAAVAAVVAGLEDEADRQRLLLIVARALAERGAAARALALAETLPDGGVRDQAYFGIAKALVAAGADGAPAAEVFQRAASLQGDDQLLLEFARAQAAAGDLRGALRTGERIAGPEAKARVYLALAKRLLSPLTMQ